MNNTVTSTKRRGCFRNGCLALFLFPLFLSAGLYWAYHSSHALPDRFVLLLPLSGEVNEIRDESSSLPFLPSNESLSLQELLFVLDHAVADKRVSEVLLDIKGVQTTPAKIAELREAIEKVRKGGKKVTAFLHSAEDSDYLLATACDSIMSSAAAIFCLMA